jgi:hypothetical protein
MSLSLIIAALMGSRPFLIALAILAGGGAYEAWKYHEQHIGGAKAVAQVTEKADENAALAKKVRDAVDTGQRGVRGRYQRPGD